MSAPILTDRQFEILEMIAVGAKRQEIAKALDIAPDTVKIHVRKILDKFSAKTIRDGMDVITDYLAAYGTHGLGYTCYFDEISQTTNISQDYLNSDVALLLKGYVVRGTIDDVSMRVKSEGDIFDFTINDKVPNLTRIEQCDQVANIALDRSLNAGDRFQRKVTYRTRHVEPKWLDYVCIMIASPVTKVVLRANFEGAVPSDWKVSLLRGFTLIDLSTDPNANIRVGDGFIEGTFEQLKSGDTYTIKWKIDNENL
jgi:hypothetical protein